MFKDKVILVCLACLIIVGALTSIMTYFVLVRLAFDPEIKTGASDTGTVKITATIPHLPKPLVVNGQTIKVLPQFHESKTEDTLSHDGRVLTKIYIAE